MSDEEEKLWDFFKIHTHLQDHYFVAETMEEAIAKFRKIDSDTQIQEVTYMGYIHGVDECVQSHGDKK